MQRLKRAIALLSVSYLILATSLFSSVAVHVDHQAGDGIATYTSVFGPSSTIQVGGGSATFTELIQSKTITTVTGGEAIFQGEIQNKAVFNLTGGVTTIESAKNNATVNLSGDAELNLASKVGNNGIINLAPGGKLNLLTDDVFGNNTELNTQGGTIFTNGFNVSFKYVMADNTTVIDLGGADSLIDLGTFSGSGEIIFVNWGLNATVTYDPRSLIDPGNQLVFEGAGSEIGNGTISPAVPEPAYTVLTVMLAAALFRRFNKVG